MRSAALRRSVGLAAHLGRGVQRIATDAVIGRVRSLPRTIGDLDAAYLSRLMGRTVTSVSVIGGDAGTSSRARLALTGDGRARLGVRQDARRNRGDPPDGRDGPARRDRDAVLPGVVTGTDGCAHVPTGPHSTRSPAVSCWCWRTCAVDDCEFPDTLHPLDTDRASLIVELLARLHATFWGGAIPRLGVHGVGRQPSLLTGPLLKTSARRIAERTDIAVGTGRFIDENYRAVARLIDTAPHTVMHGDAHPGNVYFRNGAAGLLDWQAVRRGHPGRELAYTLITSMTTADRQASSATSSTGTAARWPPPAGPDLDRDELWERYRQGALYAYIAALITAGMGGMQDEDIALEGLRRAVAALEDLDTVAVLKKLAVTDELPSWNPND